MSLSRITSCEVELLPEITGWRYEIIDGELYVSTAPSWWHQFTCGRFISALDQWGVETGLGTVLPGSGVIFADDDNVIPDVLWISYERLRAMEDHAGHIAGPPELVIEVLSPGRQNQMRDREAKLDLFQRKGVPEYWLVDSETKQVAVYRWRDDALLLVATLGEGDALTSPLLPGFSCPVASLFPARP